jgi:hypothetical protein
VRRPASDRAASRRARARRCQLPMA